MNSRAGKAKWRPLEPRADGRELRRLWSLGNRQPLRRGAAAEERRSPAGTWEPGINLKPVEPHKADPPSSVTLFLLGKSTWRYV